MEKLKALFIKYKEVMMYLIFGVATTVVNWVTYIVATNVCGLGDGKTELTISNGIAWVVAVTFAFVTNKLFVFESKCTTRRSVLREVVTFFGARAFSGLFEIFLPGFLMAVGLGQTVFGVKGAVAKAVTSVLVIVMNYVLSKLLVFRKKDKQEEPK